MRGPRLGHHRPPPPELGPARGRRRGGRGAARRGRRAARPARPHRGAQRPPRARGDRRVRGRRPARARARRRAAPRARRASARPRASWSTTRPAPSCSYRKPAMADSLAGRTLFITGGSRGIGLAIAAPRGARRRQRRAARQDRRAAPEAARHRLHRRRGDRGRPAGSALPIVGDVRDADSVAAAVEQAAERFGGIDILVNNASAISLTPIEQTEPKRYDLMQSINVRGTFLAIARLHPAPQALGQRPHPHALAADQPRPRAGSARTPPTRSRSTA